VGHKEQISEISGELHIILRTIF